jgi:hypothetical protein
MSFWRGSRGGLKGRVASFAMPIIEGEDPTMIFERE